VHNYLTPFLILSVIALVYVYYGRRKIILPNEQNLIILKQNWIPLIFGIVYIVIYCVPFYFATKHPMMKNLTILSALLFFPLLLLAYHNLKSFINHKLIFNDEELIIYNSDGQRTNLDWNDIIDVQRGGANILSFSSHVTLRTKIYDYKIDPNLIGFKNFEVYLDKNNPDMGTMLQFALYHDYTGGNNSL